MQFFMLFSALITLAAVFSYFNVRFLKLPSGISLMLMGVIVSVGLISTGILSSSFTSSIKESLAELDFSKFILGILLSFLLFAGSLHVHWAHMKSSAKSIFSFATLGTLMSTGIIGTAIYYLFLAFNMNVPYIECLLFGSLISPTDPIAVMGIISKENLSKSIEIKIIGESLFNDGIGVVVFVTLLGIASRGIENITVGSILLLFARETFGGILTGLVIGYIGFRMMKSIDDFPAEILISLAMVMGGYALCNLIHVSGPLAMVVAGLITGNKGKKEAMSDITMDYLEKFWEVIDHILNAILFMLIGLEIVIVVFRMDYFWIGLTTAILLVGARYISLLIPSYMFGIKKTLEKHTLAIMSWGGLRGGISIALALSLPSTAHKDIFVPITFIIVLFSIMVQGLSMGRFIRYLRK
ncbi:MAG: sodium:proton antiporter [Chryseolinea sp.]